MKDADDDDATNDEEIGDDFDDDVDTYNAVGKLQQIIIGHSAL